MRFNAKEVAKLGDGNSDIEGILCYLKPQENDWSDWYQRQSFKERMFKLISNLLFYYRLNEQQPLGVIVLENSDVACERPFKGFPYTFTITFRVNNSQNSDQKHVFFCRSQEEVERWVSRLKPASYEHWRSQLTILKTKISMRTGKDPVLDYINRQQNNKGNANNVHGEKSVCATKSTFQSHIEITNQTALESTINHCNLVTSSVIPATELSRTNSDLIPVARLLDI